MLESDNAYTLEDHNKVLVNISEVRNEYRKIANEFGDLNEKTNDGDIDKHRKFFTRIF